MKEVPQPAALAWFWVVASLGFAWNSFAAVQFVNNANSLVDSLVKAGMTFEQAAFYVKLPVWLHYAASAVSATAGVVGCVLLLRRKDSARLILLISLIAYVARYALDAELGFFKLLGALQIAFLTSFIFIPGALYWMANSFKKRGVLR